MARDALADDLMTVLDGRWRDVRERSRRNLDRADLVPDPSLDSAEARARTLGQLHLLVPTGYPAAGFREEHGGTGDAGGSIAGIEMLAYADLSLMVKAGVQWGLFGGAIENLGTQRHHDAYIKALINLDLLGCFAMTETGHGSDVQNIGTTATYDRDNAEFVIHTPTPAARKDYIGGAAQHASVAVVFAQLTTAGAGEERTERGVHCFVVPLRDDNGDDLPGVTTSDCGIKGGLEGVDNGRIVFDHVRVPRGALLNRYADVDEDGTYTSPIEEPNRRFFTMLGTLIRGRISIAAGGGAAARVALTIATRYALQRRQFRSPGHGDPESDEVLIMDYLTHQRRLLPLIARSYGLQLALNDLIATMHDLQGTGDDEDQDPLAQRELEGRAAGIKAATTWHATRAIQECREACGGAGYLAENRLTILKADTDVFTTFEGDNHVLMQLVAKELLTAYSDEVRGMGALDTAKFVAASFAEAVKERATVTPIVQGLVDVATSDDQPDLLDRATQQALFEDREQHLLETVARRLRRAGEDDAFDVFNDAQDHVVRAGRAHVDRIVLDAFVAAIGRRPDGDAKVLLERVCDLYALSVIDEDRAWFLEHKRLSTGRAKALTLAINGLCRTLRPHARTLVDAFGVPEVFLDVPMLRS